MNIGFDLDRIFIDYPPFVPAKLIDWLYRDPCKKELSYRIPTWSLEQRFRRLTHLKLLRPPIPKNIDYINSLSCNHQHQLFLISSRYQFLEKLTLNLLKNSNLLTPFTSIHLNTKNEQPHLFKEKTIKALHINLYIDDDLELLLYLQKTCPATKFLWYHSNGNHHCEDRIIKIKELGNIQKFLKT